MEDDVGENEVSKCSLGADTGKLRLIGRVHLYTRID